jgi:hypothetical protein
MEVVSNRDELIFRKDFEGKPSYSIGLSKKDKNGNFENGYMNVRFKQDVELKNKTKISIKNAWLSFNLKDNKTYPYIFINDFAIVEEENKNPYQEMRTKVESDIGQQIEIDPSELPF